MKKNLSFTSSSVNLKGKFLVFHLTRRRNYDVSQILSQSLRLTYLVTDFYTKNTFLDYLLKLFNNNFLRFRNSNINDEFVCRSFIAGFLYRFFINYLPKEYYNRGLLLSSKFLTTISSFKLKNNSFNSIYAFDTGAYHIFKKYSNGRKLILEQCVVPRSVQVKMYKKISNSYNLCFDQNIKNCSVMLDVENKEFSLANKIICPSEYVKINLVKKGVNPDKINLVPYGFTNPLEDDLILKNLKTKQKSYFFNILFVGNEAARKGVIDIIDVANKLKKIENISFDLVGDISDELKNYKIKNIPSNITLHGKLDKEKLFNLYLKSNLFFMPSYFEGSALVNYEALSFGIPLLTTFESGSVIKNNKQGYIVKPGDTSSMATIILSLCNDKNLCEKLSFNSFELSKEYTIEKYSERLKRVLGI